MAETGTLARPYARAIFELARDDGSLTEWSVALEAVSHVVENAEAKAFLSRRELDNEARVTFLVSVCGETGGGQLLGSERGRNLLRLLAENRRLEVLPEISNRFEVLKNRAENTITVRLVTAAGVEESVVSRIGAALERRLGRAVELELQEDPELLGGAVIHAEGQVIDGSVRSRLTELAGAITA